jgi:heme-degrading monooxygenase HmoA
VVVFVLSLRHRVHDFHSWKAVFDDRLDARQAGKVTGHRLTRSADDPHEVEVVMEFQSRADAEAYRDYMEKPETRAALAQAGVEEHAPMWIGEQIETASY